MQPSRPSPARVGAIVALDPRSGAVLAWASAPTFDNTNIQAAIEAANASGGADTSMYDRATLALYTPGSTFKVLTLASALENGLATLDHHLRQPGTHGNRRRGRCEHR